MGEEKMKPREDKRMIKKIYFFFFPKLPFWTYVRKISTFIFWCMVIPLGPHSVYTWWGAQRLCELFFSRNGTREVGWWNWTMGGRVYWGYKWQVSRLYKLVCKRKIFINILIPKVTCVCFSQLVNHCVT